MRLGTISVVSAALVLLAGSNAVVAESGFAVDGCPQADPGSSPIVSGDILFFGNEDSTHTIVPADGKVVIPLAGEVQLLGQTPDHLAQLVRERLTKYKNHRDVQLRVEDDGNQHPCGFAEPAPTTVMEALDQIGVVHKLASDYKARILRGRQTLRFNYKEARKGKDSGQNIIIEESHYSFTIG